MKKKKGETFFIAVLSNLKFDPRSEIDFFIKVLIYLLRNNELQSKVVLKIILSLGQQVQESEVAWKGKML